MSKRSDPNRADAPRPRPCSADQSVFTTGEAAELAGLSQQTIIRNFDAGRLKGYRVPGSRFRRIPRESLLAFLRENGLPTTAMGRTGQHRVLVVDDDPEVLAFLDEVLRIDGRFEVRSVNCGYAAGLESAAFEPDLILLDYMLPDINGDRVCELIRANEAMSSTRILIVSGAATDEETQRLLAAGADGFLQKPFGLGKLLRQIETLLGLPASN